MAFEVDLKSYAASLVGKVSQQVVGRSFRASNELRTAALTVLRGQRTGKVYRRPFSQGTYTASAPGEPPAVRSGDLRRKWVPVADMERRGRAVTVRPGISTDLPYAPKLEEGTGRMEPRPYRQAVIERAAPAVKAIFKEPYLNK